jgi:hypothetical protein
MSTQIEEELRAVAERDGWEIERGAENETRPWQSHWIARRNGRFLYGDPASILKRISDPRTERVTTTQEAEMVERDASENGDAKTNGYAEQNGVKQEERTSPMSKKSDFIEEYAPVPRSGYSDSQSPQAHRGGRGDLGSGDVQDGLHLNQRVAPENRGAFDNASRLRIEDENPR